VPAFRAAVVSAVAAVVLARPQWQLLTAARAVKFSTLVRHA
jgi:hypothetical protein